MLTADAIAKYLAFSNKNIVFVCAGTKGNFALEDALAAGYIIQKITLAK
ncbi:2-phosphosulfolactate phosphatase [Peptococcaceae bacterium]|jgi:phosphosulfolactate phosphohydrolase-like enzyme|nr:2-phosphosulfolactate phosphatase [Peptococcaceae bacterium]